MTGPALFLPDPALHDARTAIALRPWHDGDAPALAAAWADPGIAAHCEVPRDAGPDRATTWIGAWAARMEEGAALDLVVADAASGGVLGEVGLRPFRAPPNGAAVDGVLELGWWMGSPHRGAGRASAAVRLVAEWALLAHLADKVVARVDRGHSPSEAVARRAGLLHRGSLDTEHDLWLRSAAIMPA